MAVLPALTLGLTVASAAAGVVGSMAQANAQKQQLKAEQQTAIYNANVTKQNAYNQELSHESQDQYAIEQNNAKLAQMRATFGSSGLAFTGSTMDVLQSNANAMGQSIANSDYDNNMQQWGNASKVAGLNQQAAAYGQQAKNAGMAGILGAGTSVLSAGNSFMNTDYAQKAFG